MTTITDQQAGDGPMMWHYSAGLEEAIEIARAAERLDLAFRLQRTEREIPDEDDTDSGTIEVGYVVAVYAPGEGPGQV